MSISASLYFENIKRLNRRKKMIEEVDRVITEKGEF